MRDNYSLNKIIVIKDQANIVDSYAYFRRLLSGLSRGMAEYLDGSNILVNQKLEEIVDSFDSVTNNNCEELKLNKKQTNLLRGYVDDLEALRVDLYNERLLYDTVR